ncbi:MAG TPA: EAL domain-containing protein [Chloroflexota bacterium]|nr:EAL domain-containing protein [Chloroflexota bacterium]
MSQPTEKAVWTVSEEIDNLASALVQAYEELHLLYELGATLTSEVSVAAGADIILDRILTTVPAVWAELRVGDTDVPVHTRGDLNGAVDALPNAPGDYHIETTLQSGGEVVGSIALWRLADAQPFSSADRKLLEAVGTLAATAIRNTQLYDELRSRADALAHQAMHDALTGLPNRTLLHDRLEQAIYAAARTSGSLALLLMDLDHFKEVNDTFGHHYGDQLLRQVGPRLRSALHGPLSLPQGRAVLRESDTIARLGGDEFAVLLPTSGDAFSAAEAAERIIRALQEPFVVEGQSLEIGASIGIALYPDHGNDAQTLYRRADIAMYTAKRNHDGFAMFATELDKDTSSRLALTSELRHAIDHNELELHYQPKVYFEPNRRLHVEALVRWNHPRLGFMPPDQFIPLAEQTGLIKPLSNWVLREALRQCTEWRRLGFNVSVAVNLSMRNLQDQTLPDELAAMLDANSLGSEWLKVEITESIIMADPARTLETVTRLADLGVPLSIDDFGTGYSSLAYLKRLPVHEIKIDKSFVINMATDENDATIVRSTIDLAHNLGLKVVAEGVENQEAWDQLRALGCDAAQGYHIGRPMSATAIGVWLRDAQCAEAAAVAVA